MTLAAGEFIRRFLIHVLPAGFHRIRYYGLLASGQPQKRACPCCGAQMTIIERFARGKTPRHQPTAPAVAIRIDTS
jgi:hypothetical protein